MKMTEGQNPERFDPELRFLQIDLAPFTRVENMQLALRSHGQGCQKPMGYGHHATWPEKNTFHPLTPLNTATPFACSNCKITNLNKMIASFVEFW